MQKVTHTHTQTDTHTARDRIDDYEQNLQSRFAKNVWMPYESVQDCTLVHRLLIFSCHVFNLNLNKTGTWAILFACGDGRKLTRVSMNCLRREPRYPDIYCGCLEYAESLDNQVLLNFLVAFKGIRIKWSLSFVESVFIFSKSYN